MTDEKSIQGAGAGRALRFGALAGLLLTVPLVAIFYVADAFLGTPFVPFDVLDWAARNLPGGLITFAIDTMVTLITTLQLGETSTAAKAAEQFMGYRRHDPHRSWCSARFSFMHSAAAQAVCSPGQASCPG